MLSLQSIHIGYSPQSPLIEEFSDSLFPGDCVGLIGRNGSGKSTLLKSLMGLVNPLAGEMKWHEQNLRTMNQRERSQIIAYNGNRRNIPSMLYVIDAVMMGRNPHKPFGSDFDAHDQEAAVAALESIGMVNFQMRYLGELSDGEIQKVMIARGIAQKAQIVLFDEPTAFLDFVAKDEFGDAVAKLRNTSIIVFSSHDLPLVERIATKKWIIDEKRKRMEIVSVKP